MACSRPNLIGVDKRYKGSKFLGPRFQEREVKELSNDTYYHVSDIPCGKCELCAVDRRYSRALRIMLEAESWPESTYFITLTYDNQHMETPELEHKDWRQFIKNFRQEYCQAEHSLYPMKLRKGKIRKRSITFKTIKQVMTGEYGDTFGRKHFHGIIFNHTFNDISFTGEYSNKGNPIYTSESLQRVWKKGRVQLARVEWDLALYVSSYVTDIQDDPTINNGKTKKQYGLFGRGIGLGWITKYYDDIYKAGRIKLLDGEYPVPRYFLKWMEENTPVKYEKYRTANLLRSLQKRDQNIKKGDGPLRRARAKGVIYEHTKQKRKKDEAFKTGKPQDLHF